jgi:hypothetical protein
MAAAFPVSLEWSAKEAENFINLVHNEDDEDTQCGNGCGSGEGTSAGRSGAVQEEDYNTFYCYPLR